MLKDTDVTYEELLELTTASIANAVKLVTKEENYKMEEYINRIEKNEIAKMVKLADRIHNLLEAHFASNKWINKYVAETKEWYLDMAKGTVFEKQLKEVIAKLEN